MRATQVTRLKGKFLKLFAEYGNITTAARLTGIERKTVYNWQEADDQFAAAFREADIVATEVLEAEARRRAVEGVQQVKPIYYQGFQVGQTIVTEYSDRLIEMLLKARAPDRYRERYDATIHGQGLSQEFTFVIQSPTTLSAQDEDEGVPNLADADDD